MHAEHMRKFWHVNDIHDGCGHVSHDTCLVMSSSIKLKLDPRQRCFE